MADDKERIINLRYNTDDLRDNDAQWALNDAYEKHFPEFPLAYRCFEEAVNQLLDDDRFRLVAQKRWRKPALPGMAERDRAHANQCPYCRRWFGPHLTRHLNSAHWEEAHG